MITVQLGEQQQVRPWEGVIPRWEPQCPGALELHRRSSQESQGTRRGREGGREEGSGCLAYWIHQDSIPGVSVELKVSLLAALQVRLGHESHQIQSLKQE